MPAASSQRGAERPIRILGLSEGNHQRAMSGVAACLFDALDGRFQVVDRLDYAPRGVSRVAVATATFRPGRAAWRARFHTSAIAHRALSSTLSRRLKQQHAGFDVALQVHGWVGRQPRPYTLYLDQTRLMAEHGWPSWIPIGARERATILERERRMYVEAAHVFVMGEPTRRSLVDEYRIDPEAVTVVGGGLNGEVPTPGELTSDPRILFVGRDFERKGGDCLLEAFAGVRDRLPGAELHIVGVARDFSQPGVVSHGRISRRAQLASLYRGARVFCMPSRYEPWGLVFPEAMSYGVPCVGSTAQSIPEILGNGEAGLVVPPDDAALLADAVLRLLTDDELARALGEAGRRRVQEVYTWDHVVGRMAPALAHAAGREWDQAGVSGG